MLVSDHSVWDVLIYVAFDHRHVGITLHSNAEGHVICINTVALPWIFSIVKLISTVVHLKTGACNLCIMCYDGP